jgi:CheY-like chemotaxis protein
MVHVLIVDDEDALRSLLRRVLNHLGLSTLEACDGKEALDLVEHHRVNLVITDILMPGIDGIETIIKLRQRYPDLKIIAMSGGGSIQAEEYLSMAKMLRVDQVLRKPFNLAELSATIEGLMRN